MIPPNRHLRFAGTMALCAVALGAGIYLASVLEMPVLKAFGVGLIVFSWTTPVIYAARYKTRSEFKKTASAEDLRAVKQLLESHAKSSSQNAFTATKKHTQTLKRIEERVRTISVLQQAKALGSYVDGTDVLFVTSNGAGLGHLSRLIAISRQMNPGTTYEFLTLSKAYKQIRGSGRRVHYFPSNETSGVGANEWNNRFRAYLRNLIVEIRPRVVVFDGTWVYAALTDMCRAHGVPIIWVQRGMWKKEADRKSGQRHNAHICAEHVVVPGDFSGDEYVDSGPRIHAEHVEPIVLTTKADLLTRSEACAALGLDEASRYVLLNFGGGIVSDPQPLATKVVEIIGQLAPNLIPVQLVSPLSGSRGAASGAKSVHAYPIMKYVRAFDFTIMAAGYNSAQEAVSLETPSILVPNKQARTDDQYRRAESLASRGLCLLADDPKSIEDAVKRMLDPFTRDQIRSQLSRIEEPRGAQQAGRYVEEVVASTRWPSHARTIADIGSDGATIV